MESAQVRSILHQSAVVVGPGSAVLVAWLLSLPSDAEGSGVTLANVALVVAVVTVGFAVVDWVAGITTSVAAAFALNYFHTEPVHTLRITDRRDVLSVVLLGVLGLAVSAATAIRVRRGVAVIHHDEAAAAGQRLTALLATDQPAREVWSAAISAASNDLGLVVARLSTAMPWGLPTIARRVSDADDATLMLPAAGAALRLQHRYAEGRWLVLTPREGHGPLTVDRRAVLSFADTVELALEPSPLPTVGAMP